MIWQRSIPSRVYERSLPGGGFTAIEIERVPTIRPSAIWRGRLVVERRIEERREGHVPPVIATATGASVEAVIAQLLPSAQSNHAIGAGLLRLSPARR